MLEALAVFSVTLLGGTLGSGLLSDEDETIETGLEEDAVAPEDAVLPAEIVLPNMQGPAAWFEDFDPEHDQVVVIFPDAMGQAGIGDLGFDYDEEYDETEVSLSTAEGLRTICYLPGVAPGEMDATNFDFVSESAARAQIDTAAHAA